MEARWKEALRCLAVPGSWLTFMFDIARGVEAGSSGFA